MLVYEGWGKRGWGNGRGGGVLVTAMGCISPLAMPLSLPFTQSATQTQSRTKALLGF